MTCIVALEFENQVFMGGDSTAARGWEISKVADPKVFITGDFIVGYTSSFRMGQLLQYNLEVEGNNTDNPNLDLQYLVQTFIPAARRCLKDGGYTKIDNNREETGVFMLGYHGKTYSVFDNFQILRVLGGFAAIGAGNTYALGAYEMMKRKNEADLKKDPEAALLDILEVSGKLCGAVNPPYYIFSK